ncbi:glutathione transferase GstA [Methylobacterium sp. SD274]|uniref:glutathione transferase GstA n=1 Tax=Methylobacterium sp. SD274 TaxID=2782009 RepID=UPI001A96305A|nr:glutathione transferase GstA [Methylobacterium sp. SD274]MBO1021066.1 glutathione transferase GstA [Methylobacterium sp. SD274]
MKLFFAPGTCSFSPHIVLQELNLSYDLVRVDNRTKRTSEGRDFLAVNPKGYVAALELDDGEVLTEGPAIVQYLADLRPELGLAPANGTLERVRLQEWLNFITSEIHAGAAPLFNQTLPKPVRSTFETRLFRRLDLIDATLLKKAYLLGDRFTVADAYLYTVLGWMPGFSIDLMRWPRIDDYHSRIARRPSVVRAHMREAQLSSVS